MRDVSTEADDAMIAHDNVQVRVERLLAGHPPTTTDRQEFLRARFHAGLAWVHFPPGLGGLGLSRSLQAYLDELLVAADVPNDDSRRTNIGLLDIVAPAILAFGTTEQQQRFLCTLWTGEEVWCQLFSEPGAGSDLAGLATRADRDGDEWVVNGHKVWTSGADNADFGILVARTNPNLPKHAGLTYFLCDMHDPGVEVRPLRQITGEAEFNEVFLTDARIPDANRLGAVGDGWRVALATLMNERVAIGGGTTPREGGPIKAVARLWRERPELRTPDLQQRLLRLWVDAEVFRLTRQRQRQNLAAGSPGPAESAIKLTYARLSQQLTGLEIEMLGSDGLRYGRWNISLTEPGDLKPCDPGYRYLRAKGHSIEGGTSEILRNILAERVLGLPIEPRIDRDLPWKEIPR